LRKLGPWEVSCCGDIVGVTVGCGADFDEDVTTFGSWDGDLVYFVGFVELDVNFVGWGRNTATICAAFMVFGMDILVRDAVVQVGGGGHSLMRNLIGTCGASSELPTAISPKEIIIERRNTCEKRLYSPQLHAQHNATKRRVSSALNSYQ